MEDPRRQVFHHIELLLKTYSCLTIQYFFLILGYKLRLKKLRRNIQ